MFNAPIPLLTNRIMPAITDISPELLRDRHRLSHRQINLLYGTSVIEEQIEEKAYELVSVEEIIRVTDKLTEAGIGFIILKGLLLSYKLYGDATARRSHDHDIMVDPSVVSRAQDILIALGYRQVPPAMPSDHRNQSIRLKYSHHISFVNPGNQQIIELHWRLMNRPWLRFRNIDSLLQNNTELFDFAGRSFRVPDNETELLYLIIHGGAHRWGRLKWLVDIDEYLKSQQISWVRFKELTDRFDAGRLVSLCNEMLKRYFPEGKSIPYTSTVPSYMIKASLSAIEGESYRGPGTTCEIFSSMRFAMLAYPGWRYKCRLAGSVIVNSIFSGRLSRILG